MAYVEMSLSPADVSDDLLPPLRVFGSTPYLDAWLRAVEHAEEPCLLLDADGMIVGVSPACVALIGALSPDDLLGRGLLDDLLDLVDFTAAPGRLLPPQMERIPPLLAIASGALARGLLRVRTGDTVRTFDAVATPVRGGGQLVGSLTFFHVV